jgi:hypothetical protein
MSCGWENMRTLLFGFAVSIAFSSTAHARLPANVEKEWTCRTLSSHTLSVGIAYDEPKSLNMNVRGKNITRRDFEYSILYTAHIDDSDDNQGHLAYTWRGMAKKGQTMIGTLSPNDGTYIEKLFGNSKRIKITTFVCKEEY